MTGRRVLGALLSILAACFTWSCGPGTQLRPNVVFILADDLSWNLVQFMPNVLEMQRRGMTFTDYTVSNSLCCPSRASIFTGQYPHNTGVFSNMNGPDGGWELFNQRGGEKQTFATAAQATGYRTAMMGKYMNGYSATKPVTGGARPYEPPGWDEWVIPTAQARFGFDYKQNQNGTIVDYGARPQDYLTDVLAREGSRFIDGAAAANEPFLLEVAPLMPHSPSVPAPRDADAFPGLQAPRGAAFGHRDPAAPSWLAALPPLDAATIAQMDQDFRKRAQSVLALDAMVGTLQDALERAGIADNTFFVFSSDNGLHLGEHRLSNGKQTAFESDINVPLIVTGPGVPAGTSRDELVQNVDLSPTFQEIAAAPVPDSVDGRSFLPLLRGDDVPWRSAALIEHRSTMLDPDDPDAPAPTSVSTMAPTYSAVRTPDGTYVVYANGETAYYDLRNDPEQLRNIAGQLPPDKRESLTAAISALVACSGGTACWSAGRPVGP